jgi:hypothetical protein
MAICLHWKTRILAVTLARRGGDANELQDIDRYVSEGNAIVFRVSGRMQIECVDTIKELIDMDGCGSQDEVGVRLGHEIGRHVHFAFALGTHWLIGDKNNCLDVSRLAADTRD